MLEEIIVNQEEVVNEMAQESVNEVVKEGIGLVDAGIYVLAAYGFANLTYKGGKWIYNKAKQYKAKRKADKDGVIDAEVKEK